MPDKVAPSAGKVVVLYGESYTLKGAYGLFEQRASYEQLLVARPSTVNTVGISAADPSPEPAVLLSVPPPPPQAAITAQREDIVIAFKEGNMESLPKVNKVVKSRLPDFYCYGSYYFSRKQGICLMVRKSSHASGNVLQGVSIRYNRVLFFNEKAMGSCREKYAVEFTWLMKPMNIDEGAREVEGSEAG